MEHGTSSHWATSCPKSHSVFRVQVITNNESLGILSHKQGFIFYLLGWFSISLAGNTCCAKLNHVASQLWSAALSLDSLLYMVKEGLPDFKKSTMHLHTVYSIFLKLINWRTSLVSWDVEDDDFQQSNINCLANRVKKVTRSALIFGRSTVSGITPECSWCSWSEGHLKYPW